eukprot:CAMPEP_0197835082 /NCGR_PEP_ID=MMETSP1437-20131217/24667_1 /TAXON_ID=49252 ORGANISM="Eucampia antarctica, Strain CCMP1452" /NCGR_SAMPLE_ID=MMETSP1437 /ASSEMBLY_ACC=CAM_ASM_001096 /LENGTH=690 /DNA_ID=CAMNT_0043440257 /DNA_START=337 /DNA_END=2409 /DNA_ORIENTATION=+
MTEVENPLLKSWHEEPFLLPPFGAIEVADFEPAFEVAMKGHVQDLQTIVDSTEKPSFANVIEVYDRAGLLMDKISGVYGNYVSSLNTDAMQQVQMRLSPILSRHSSQTYTLPGLFDKIQKLHQKRSDLSLNSEQLRLLERVYMDFTRQGAHFDTQSQKEYADLKAQLAELQTQFNQNVMKDEEEWHMLLTVKEMDGCPENLIEAARQAALVKNYTEDDQYIITTSRSLVEPFLTYANRRDLRERACTAWTNRGQLDPDRNNIKTAENILKLRQRQANLHGHSSFAEYQCLDRMAKTPQNVMKLLENVWERAKVSAERERNALEEFVRQQPGDTLTDGIQPWDWRFYAEKVRIAKYDFDESLLKPYLSLNQVTQAVMAVSNNLFGLKYKKRTDISSYHPDVDTYEVTQGDDDSLVAIFLHDNYARPHKSSGAWMSEFRSQTDNLPSSNDEMQKIPIVANNNNFAKANPTLLSFDDATTLFHEMGHAHHGMLSKATYGRLASTNVLTDFVELPSQLMEHWLKQPQVLKEFAKHYKTGQPVPDELLQKLEKAQSFNQGFATIEFTICALLDMSMHQIQDYTDFDLVEFEKQEMERLGMPQGIVMRHRPAHFQHLFSTSGYAAGYYVYQWAEVLDADVFAAFEESGDIFDSETAEKARKFIYSAGNTVAPDELFRRFRGRDPDISFMLKKKGLI